jgi:hypothetical protein
MQSILVSLFQIARLSIRSRAALQLELLALRHQVQALQRSRRRRVLTQADRLLCYKNANAFLGGYRLWKSHA